MNICMVGYGMMGVWHSDGLKEADCCLHTIVGRRPEPTREFASRYGYLKSTIDFSKALSDPEIDVVILAIPSELHAEYALAALSTGKHTLVEIPIAMNLADSERVVAAGKESGLTLGVVHPLRVRREMADLKERVLSGEEEVRHIGGRFFIHRLTNVGGTGYERSWTDNLLWHHTTHLLDFGLWMLDEPVRRVQSFMPLPHTKTGVPMEAFIGLETERDQSLVCTGSYCSHEKIFDALITTDQNSYRLDVMDDELVTKEGAAKIASQEESCGMVARDFVASVREGRSPLIPGESVLPAMRVLQEVQDRWDERHGARSIPGRAI